ncbi:hypothetical protein GCM10027570_10420 [Streptomonospora sediminis]
MHETPVPVVLAGAHGHGRSHLRKLRILAEEGLVRLVGVCDRVPLPAEELAAHPGVEQDGDLGALLRRTGAVVTVLCTPIHTHLPLARTALEHGSHLLLEKPPTATATEFSALREAVDASGLACQIGFQSLGSAAIDAVRSMIADGAIGTVRGIAGAGTWVRSSAYYARAEWAGRRSLGGLDVVDGVLTNPLAHAVATALAVASAQRGVAGGIELELFRAHEIESDDTSCVRVHAPDGTPISVAATLCAATARPPRLVVHGDAGRITLFYTFDEVRLERPDSEPEVSVHPRTELLRNLVAHVRGKAPLAVPPEETAGFMAVLDAVRRAPAPVPIPADLQRITDDGGALHRVVEGVDDLVALSAERVALFSELAAPWAARRTEDVRLRCGGGVVAEWADGTGVEPHLSPRPYLHPVRTRAGTIVTEIRPDDHLHHLGVGVAVPDVNGSSFWGGTTFVRDRGPVLLDDHGRQEHRGWESVGDNRLVERLAWVGRDGGELLSEVRETAAWEVDERMWALDLRTRLLAGDCDLEMNSPATKGRPGAGYGGFFWRAPKHARPPRVLGPGAEGEEALHESCAPWVALQGGADSGGAPWTLVFAAAGAVADPWFVRAGEYPGVGGSLAWRRPLRVSAHTAVERRVITLVADGHPAPADLAARVESARARLGAPEPERYSAADG